jgi:3'-5' exoribonuclease
LSRRIEDVFGLIVNKEIRSLVESCLSDIAGDLPGSITQHHKEDGGLATHLCDTAMTGFRIASGYPDKVNIDVVVAACLLHDIGKNDCYTRMTGKFVKGEWTSGPWSKTPKDKYLGHISLGFHKVLSMAEKMGIAEKEEIQNLLHCILSHHGRKEWGSPVEPATSEALIVHSADYLDAFISKGF